MAEKWSINALSDECGLDRRTIKKLLTTAEPADWDGENALYWMRDLVEALREKQQSEKDELIKQQTRLTEVNADIAEVSRAERRNEVIETETAFRVWENIGLAVRRVILVSELDEQSKDRILTELRSLKVEDFLEQREFDKGTPAEMA